MLLLKDSKMYHNEKILTEARNSLTPVNWRKGTYFQQDHNTLCMCAHGAVQALVNPVCRERLLLSDIAGAGALARVGARASADQGKRAGERAGGSASANWTNRPDWVKNDIVSDRINYGNGDANYLLGMVGLTVSFNDHSGTTYEMVIEKFNEAIQLANQLGI